MADDEGRRVGRTTHTTLEGGTDAATMFIFDPAALPADPKMSDDPYAVLESLHEEGRAYLLSTDADGGYSLGVFLAGELPAEHAAFAREIATAERFAAPSGALYFAGAEYAFRNDDSFLRKHPHMGSCMAIPIGVYHLKLFGMDYPDDFHEDLLRQRLTSAQFWAYSLMNWLAPLGCVSTLATIVSFFLLGLRIWSRIALPLWLAILSATFVLSRLRPYREAVAAQTAIADEYPGYFALLRSLAV